MFEISSGAQIYSNTVCRQRLRHDDWGWGPGILISSSDHANVYKNVLAWNARGISVISQARQLSPHTDNLVHDNVIINRSSKYVAGFYDDHGGSLYDASSDNRGYDNRYWIGSGSPSGDRFHWSGGRSEPVLVQRHARRGARQVHLHGRTQPHPRLARTCPQLSPRVPGPVRGRGAPSTPTPSTRRTRPMASTPRRLPATHRIPAALAAIVIALAAIVIPSSTRSVDAACGSFQSLVDGAPSGGSVTIPACTYSEIVEVRKPLTINAYGATIDGGNSRGYGIKILASDVTVNGLTVTRVKGGDHIGAVWTTGISRFTFRDGVARDSATVCVSLNGGSGHRIIDSS